MQAGPFALALALGGALALTGCTGHPSGQRAGVSATSTSSVSTPPTTTAAPAPAADPVSLQALMTQRYDGRALHLGRVLARTGAYTRWFVTYRSGNLTISGVMNVPTGKGPFPVLVLAHGYFDPAVYRNGQGLPREQDYLARHGYVVLHTDYRNYAQSGRDPGNELDLRLGYTVDVINAVLAVKRSTLPSLDRDHVGLLGRSMGGGVVLNALVAQPGLVDAAVIFSSVSSDAVDNFDRWVRGEPGRGGLAARIIAAHGSPEGNPVFWRNVSPRTFFGRVTEPVLLHHGTADGTCPISWSRATVTALQRAGKDAVLFTYPGEGHTFGAAWPLAMRRTVAFFDEHLRARGTQPDVLGPALTASNSLLP